MPSTDIWLFDVEVSEQSVVLSNPLNITARKGYDSQPYFNDDKSTLLYSAEVNGQTDIFEYNVKDGKTRDITMTKTSEYSPSLLRKKLVVLMVEKDSSQRIWVNPGTRKAKRLTEIKGEQIGYYYFFGRDSVATYILGEPSKFKLYDLKRSSASIVTDSIGRCFKGIPEHSAFTFTRILSKEPWLYKYDRETRTIEKMMKLPAEDYEWISDKLLISSNGTELLLHVKGTDKWEHVQITQRIALNGITRISYSPSLKKLAVVMAEQ
jgi:hypothetical protein